MFCHKCGAQIAEGADFCHKCGTKVVYEEIVQQPTDTPISVVEPQQASAMGATTSNDAQQTSTAPTPTTSPMADESCFKTFVDRHIQASTNFQSAQELLDSHVPQKFMWICFGVPAVIGFIAGGPLGALLFGLFFGYPAVLLTDFMKGSRATGSIEKISSGIDSDDLIQFLNKHLSYLAPYFHEWGYINYSGFGVRGAVTAHALNSITASAAKVGTGFGRRQRCFVVIWIEPDGTDPDSNGMKYYFSTAMKSPWPSKYICMNKTVPILQAAMEYYLKYGNNA